jgi:arginine decarboxylase
MDSDLGGTMKKSTPIFTKMLEYRAQNPVRFHVPGHKGRTSPDLPFYALDLTEITGLDDLHQPSGVIREAQQLAAEVFHAEETFFLVGGSTVGNLALILTVCKPGDEIIIQRNVHKSVINGLILAQAHPIYLPPKIDPLSGLAVGVEIPTVEQILSKHPQAKAVFLSNPNYFGMGEDLRSLADLCKRARIPLLVDEAHGAHFGLSPRLPPSAMQSGACAAVQSTHKMLSSLTMSSMLHVQGGEIDRSKLRTILTMLQSSSPSYPLLASLDLTRKYIAEEGRQALDDAIARSAELVGMIEESGVLWLDVLKQGQYSYLDPLKVTLRSRASAYTGYSLKQFFEHSRVYPELADERHILFVLSLATTTEDITRVCDVLRQLPKHATDMSFNHLNNTFTFAREIILQPHQAFHRTTERLPFESSVGHVAGEMIVPDPPGVALINPGERMDKQIMLYLKELQGMGCQFHGVSDPLLNTIEVIKDL